MADVMGSGLPDAEGARRVGERTRKRKEKHTSVLSEAKKQAKKQARARPRREALKAGLDADQAATKAAADKELGLLGGVLELELPAPLPPPPPKSECGSSWHARLEVELCLVSVSERAKKFGTLHVYRVCLCACCGHYETGSCLVSARATRTYASGRVGTKLNFFDWTRPGFYLLELKGSNRHRPMCYIDSVTLSFTNDSTHPARYMAARS